MTGDIIDGGPGSGGQPRADDGVTADDWLVADSLWWGPGTLLAGGWALPLRDGAVVTGPVPVAELPAAAPRRHLPGTLLPGLCDAHVHSDLVDLAAVRSGGIAAVWDLGGVPEKLVDLRKRSAAADSGLPRMTIAGQFLTAPGGYPSDRAWAAAGSWRELRSAQEARDAVADCRALGAQVVKVTINTHGPTLPPPILHALVDHAHTLNTPVVAHAEGPGAVAAACDAGIDLLAHTPWTETVDDGLLRAAAGNAMTWISTLDIHGWGTPTPAAPIAADNLQRFLGYGGSLRYGTDLGNGPLPPGVNVREIRALLSTGLTPDQVLAAMTTDPTGVPPCWIAGGLDLDPSRFADMLGTARVVGPELRPRPPA